jgi:hypothetical protein
MKQVRRFQLTGVPHPANGWGAIFFNASAPILPEV